MYGDFQKNTMSNCRLPSGLLIGTSKILQMKPITNGKVYSLTLHLSKINHELPICNRILASEIAMS